MQSADIGSKLDRLVTAFSQEQSQNRCANLLLHFIESTMAPALFASAHDQFEERRDGLNRILIHEGFCVLSSGKIDRTAKANSIDEARSRLNRLRQRLSDLGIHDQVVKYCRSEIQDSNYFHAVFEASKSLPDRVRILSGESLDGHELFNQVFPDKAPMLAINSLATDVERAAQRAVVNMMKSLFTLYRNPLAHTSKIHRPMTESEAVEALMVFSFVHRQLDNAVLIRRGCT